MRVCASLVCAVVVTLLASSCSSGEQGSEAPTRADVEQSFKIVFPDSTDNFLLTSIDANNVNVRFDLDQADVETFATNSDLQFVPNERTILHASPLWELNVDGEISGASSEFDGATRNVEIITDDELTWARVSINY